MQPEEVKLTDKAGQEQVATRVPATLHNCLSDSLTHSVALLGGSPFEPRCTVIAVVREIPDERDIQRKRQQTVPLINQLINH